MAGGLYSTRFIAADAFTGTINYTVPGNKRAVVRQLLAINSTAVAATLYVFVAGNTFSLKTFAAGSVQFYEWQGSVVIMKGEVLKMQSTAALAMYAGGYLFDDP